MSITNSNNNFHDFPSSITIVAADDQIADAPDHQTTSNIVLPSLSPGRNETFEDGHQATAVPPLEATGHAVAGDTQGETHQPQRIPMDAKLYQAAVEGNINFLEDLLRYDRQQLDRPSPLQGVSIGDNTVLHIVAISSNRNITKRHRNSSYREFAQLVYWRNKSLLMARNKLKETPLHCAAKAGNLNMVSLIISLAEHENHFVKGTLLTLLTARNMHGETVLHEAVRIGHRDIVNRLIISEPRLAGIADAEGVSPLYLAAMTNAFKIVQVFTAKEPSLVSCAGPRGQTALHVAVLQHTGITDELLKWDQSLATRVDDSGSTPLHYAASIGAVRSAELLLQIQTSAAYIADNEGLYPIHVAAKCGDALLIKKLIEHVPDPF